MSGFGFDPASVECTQTSHNVGPARRAVTIHCPLRDQSVGPSGPPATCSRESSPPTPLAGLVKTLNPVAGVAAYATRLPSGDQTGQTSSFFSKVRREVTPRPN